jgi:hypothetical protein
MPIDMLKINRDWELGFDNPNSPNKVSMSHGEGDLEPIALAMPDTIIVITAKPNPSFRDPVESAKHPQTQKHGMDPLKFQPIRVHLVLGARCLCKTRHPVLGKRVFNTPSSRAQITRQVLHIRAITNSVSSALLDSPDQIGRISGEGTVPEGPIIGVSVDHVRNSGING